MKVQGLWAEKSLVQEYRSTKKIPANVCKSASAQGAYSAEILRVDASGNVSFFEPSKEPAEETKIFVFQNGKLHFANEPEDFKGGAFFSRMEKNGIRLHRQKIDSKTGQKIASDEVLYKTSETEAKEIRAQEDTCIGSSTSGRITTVPVGTGHLTLSGGISRDITYSSANDNYVECEMITLGERSSMKYLSLAAYSNTGNGANKIRTDGLEIYTLPTNKRDGSIDTVTFPAVSPITTPNLALEFSEDANATYSGTCALQVNQVLQVLEAKVHCDSITRKDSKTKATQQATLDVQYACYLSDLPPNP
jgi:hypothetical protein